MSGDAGDTAKDRTEDRYPCSRCAHSPFHHRLDDSTNVSPTDPTAEFRCTWPTLARHDERMPRSGCGCPDFVAPDGYDAWIESVS